MKFIILDRDGVINHDSEFYIKNPDEWLPIPGSIDAIVKLYQAGFKIVIATNQAGVGRGLYSLETLHAIHDKFKRLVTLAKGEVHDIFFCIHHPDDKCHCRKPQPGMLLAIKEKYSLNLNDIYFVGDSPMDVQAALAAGCKPILVLTGNGLKTLEKFPEYASHLQFADLAAVADFVIQEKSDEK